MGSPSCRFLTPRLRLRREHHDRLDLKHHGIDRELGHRHQGLRWQRLPEHRLDLLR